MEDLGSDMINHVYDSMAIDEQWSQRDDSGFTWWGGKLAQRVRFDPPVEDEGYSVWKLHARTDLVRGWSRVEQGAAKLATLARLATISGPLYDPADPDGAVQLASTLYVHEQTAPFVKHLFAFVCAVQAAEAHTMAEMLVAAGSPQPAYSPHPSAGLREQPDEMLDVIEAMVVPKGQEPSRWIGGELGQLVELLRRPPCVLVNGDDRGLTAEFPFSE